VTAPLTHPAPPLLAPTACHKDAAGDSTVIINAVACPCYSAPPTDDDDKDHQESSSSIQQTPPPSIIPPATASAGANAGSSASAHKPGLTTYGKVTVSVAALIVGGIAGFAAHRLLPRRTAPQLQVPLTQRNSVV
jgi:hypothetical protein